MINYKGISRERLLAELFNNAINNNILNDRINVMSEEDMRANINHYDKSFGFKNYKYDVIGGRDIWVDLENEEEFDGETYDKYNVSVDDSCLSAQEVVDKIRLEMNNEKNRGYVKKRK